MIVSRAIKETFGNNTVNFDLLTWGTSFIKSQMTNNVESGSVVSIRFTHGATFAKIGEPIGRRDERLLEALRVI